MRSTTDEDIARQIAEDPDVAPDMGDVPLSEFRLVVPVERASKNEKK